MQRVQRCAGLQGLVTQLIRRPQASAALLQQLPCLLSDYKHQDGPFDVWSPGAICRQYASPAAFQVSTPPSCKLMSPNVCLIRSNYPKFPALGWGWKHSNAMPWL